MYTGRHTENSDFGFAALGYVVFGLAIKKDKKDDHNRA
jgi:hypothetical protein